jgi:hypothetical protein
MLQQKCLGCGSAPRLLQGPIHGPIHGPIQLIQGPVEFGGPSGKNLLIGMVVTGVAIAALFAFIRPQDRGFLPSR